MAILGHCVRLVALLAIGLGVQSVGPVAHADGCHTEHQALYVNGLLQFHNVTVCGPDGSASSTEQVVLPTDSDLDAVCVNTAISNGVDPFAFCNVPDGDDATALTTGLIAEAFARIPLPASTLHVQPPNGRTLVNFETNFFTQSQPFDVSETLLGQRVDFHIVPSAFGWRFGDGDSVTTAEPGAPYPHLDVTHSYLKKGRVAPSVDTTYTAQFRVNGGGWADVPGEVTVPGAPVQLEVLTATPTLVGYNS